MKRWQKITANLVSLEESPDGAWVLWSDVKPLLAALKACDSRITEHSFRGTDPLKQVRAILKEEAS